MDQSNFTIRYQYVYCVANLANTFSSELKITVGSSTDTHTWYDGTTLPADASGYGGSSFAKVDGSSSFKCNASIGSDKNGETHNINSYTVSYEYSSRVDRNESVLVQISNFLDNHNYWFMIGNVEIDCEGLCQLFFFCIILSVECH